MSNQIEIKIEGQKLTPEKFIEGVESFFALVRGVAKNLGTGDIHWQVEVDKGSAIVRMQGQGRGREPEKAIRAVCHGVRALRSGVRTLPHGFSPSELRASKRLAELIDGTDVRAVSIKNGDAPEDLPNAVAEVAEDILTGQLQTAFGSIEGKIDSLSDKHVFTCSILDPLLSREIVCYFKNDQAVIEEAVKGFRKRVLVHGLIRYAKEGFPTSIVVDEVRIFPEESDLPTIEDVQAVYKQYR